jgi:Tn7-like transposition protein D/TniQ
MIGFFPDPYPDELLYSSCARYAQRVNYPNKQTAMIDLFGKRGLSAVVDFPTRLKFFLSVITNENYSADEIINKNTLFPFYEPFLVETRAKVVREEMTMITDNRIRTRLATNINQINSPNFLRYCPVCIEIDRKEFGETYWHRIHQIPGISICPEHKCLLIDSSINWNRRSSSFFHAAEDFVELQKPSYINSEDVYYQNFIFLAENAKWLLEQENLALPAGVLRERYHNILLEKGYAYCNGRVKLSKLVRDFTDFYPQAFLEDLGCSLNSESRNWLSKMIEKFKSSVLHHPIRHLLLMNFLKTNAKKFLQNFVEFKPFGEPPYPCLNKVSSHFGELTINSYKIFDNSAKKEKHRQPVAVFGCNCGFIYRRIGPDKTPEDKFRYNSVSQYGDLWEQKLASDWQNLDLSLAEIARRFSTTTHLVARHAIRLNLPINTEGTRCLQGYKRHFNPRNDLSQKLAKNRANWLKKYKKHPQASREILIKKFPFLYSWLQKHDTEWFESNLPKPQKVYRKNPHLNWEKIDIELSKAIKKVGKEIIRTKGRLIRISLTEIARKVGHKSWIENRKAKLPLVTKVIDEILEPLEDFMLRKLLNTESRYIKEMKVPTRQQLIRRASINNTTTASSSRIQDEINMSLERIIREVCV